MNRSPKYMEFSVKNLHEVGLAEPRVLILGVGNHLRMDFFQDKDSL